ncbi:MAG: HAMP domain-containing histidine kinase, partial [Bacteroidetes bacterium]
ENINTRYLRILGFTILNGERYYRTNGDVLINSAGEEKYVFRRAGSDWMLTKNEFLDGQLGSFLYTPHDTLWGKNSRLAYEIGDNILIIDELEVKVYYKASGKLLTIHQLKELAEQAVERPIQVITLSQGWMIKINDEVLDIRMGSYGRAHVHSVSKIDPVLYLHQYGDAVVVENGMEYTLYSGRLDQADYNKFKSLNVNHIHRYKDKYIAISSTRGMALLTPTYVKVINPISDINRMVDGILTFNGDYWMVKRNVGVIGMGMEYDDVPAEIRSKISPSYGLQSFPFNGRRLVIDQHIYPHFGIDFIRPTAEELKDWGGDVYLRFCAALIQQIDAQSLFLQNDNHIFKLTVGDGFLRCDTILIDKSRHIYGFDSFKHKGETRYWVSYWDHFVLYDENWEEIRNYAIPKVRNVLSIGDELVVCSHLSGLFIIDKDRVEKVVINNLQANSHLSKADFLNGTFYVLGNSGLMYQDSAFVVQQLRSRHPIALANVYREFTVETNGGLFEIAIQISDSSLAIATSVGLIEWKVPATSAVQVNNLEELYTIYNRLTTELAYLFTERSKDTWEQISMEQSMTKKSDNLYYLIDNNGTYYFYDTYKWWVTPPVWLILTFSGLFFLLILYLIRLFFVRSLQRRVQKMSLKFGYEPMKGNIDLPSSLSLVNHDLGGSISVIHTLLGAMKSNPEVSKDELTVVQNLLQETRNSISSRIMKLCSREESAKESLSVIVRELKGEIAAYAKLKSVKVEFDYDPELENKEIPCSDLLKRAISITLGNALKFSPSSSKVRVEIAVEDDLLITKVEDNGPGLQPGWKIDSGIKKPGSSGEFGSGIALKIIQPLIEMVDGQITLENRTDRRGAIAIIKLPLN